MENMYKELVTTASLFAVYVQEVRKRLLKEAIETYIDTVPCESANKLMNKKFNHSEMQILSYLEAKPDKTGTYQEILKAMPFSQGLLSRYVKRLAANNLLIRFHNKEDLKAVLLRNTELGTAVALVHNDLHKREEAYFKSVLSNVPAEKIKDTLETLKLLMNGPIAISDEELNTLTGMKPKSAY